MTLVYHDPRFRYVGANRVSGVCDLKVYNGPSGKQVAIASDLVLTNGEPANDGISITNAYEQLATRVRAEIGFVPETWIEYYPDRGWKLAEKKAKGWPAETLEDFSFVTLTWESGNPTPPGWSETTGAAPTGRLSRPGRYRDPEWKFATRADVEALIGEPFTYEYCTEEVE